MKKYQNKEWLFQKYVKEGLTCQEIADEYGCGDATICRWLNRYEIKREVPFYFDFEWLSKKYVVEEVSIKDIAKICDCSRVTIQNWIKKHGIEIKNVCNLKHRDANWLRNLYCTNRKSSTEIALICGCRAATVSRWLSKFGMTRELSKSISMGRLKTKGKCKYRDEKWLRHKYVKEGLTTTEISEMCNASTGTIGRWLRKFKVETREYKGKNHPQWKGGKSSLKSKIRTSTTYKVWRTSVFDRDDYTCQECGQIGSSLHVDHIYPFSSLLDDYEIDTKDEAANCDELWDISNGRVLCVPCHKKTDTYGNRSLSEEGVFKVVHLLNNSDLSQHDIGKKVGVSASTVCQINLGNSYLHITEELVENFPIK